MAFTMSSYDDFPDDIHPFKHLKDKIPPANQLVIEDEYTIDQDTLDQLHRMDKEALISLIQRVSGAMWGVGLKTKEDIAEAFKLKLAIGGMTEKDMFKALPIMREWFDRELGKAAQSIAMTVEDKGLGKLSDQRLLRLEKELSRMTGQEAIVIPPEPQKLSASGSELSSSS